MHTARHQPPHLTAPPTPAGAGRAVVAGGASLVLFLVVGSFLTSPGGGDSLRGNAGPLAPVAAGVLQLAWLAPAWVSVDSWRRRRRPPAPAPAREPVPSGSHAKRVRAVVAAGEAMQIVFQPIVSLSAGDVVGFEALARFPTGHGWPPDRWFAEAAALGMGTELELAAIERALERSSVLPTGVYLSINLSANTLAAGPLIPLLLRHRSRPLVLELTEHELVADYDTVKTTLERLRSVGAQVAVDDAGAGHSSLQHVLRIAPDIIKLDRDIVRGVGSDPARRRLIAALVAFARDGGISIVAEGVEEVDEVRCLTDLDVSCAQGYFFGRPEPLPSAA